MSNENYMDKSDLVALLQGELQDDWGPDYDEGGFPSDKRPTEWGPEFTKEHYQAARLLAAAELLPMNLRASVTDSGDWTWIFTVDE